MKGSRDFSSDRKWVLSGTFILTQTPHTDDPVPHLETITLMFDLTCLHRVNSANFLYACVAEAAVTLTQWLLGE